MVPHSIQKNLAVLRRRERLLAFVWGAACCFSIMLVLLLLCCSIDWLIERERDTPWSVRVGLLFVQVTIAAAAGLWFVLWPQFRRLPDNMLALWVETKMPFFQHRLISAVQLNQPGAPVEGMSKELITVVTREAEQLAKKDSFSRVADHSRLKWAGWLLTPLFLLAAIPLLLWPAVCFALLSRQALLDEDIPHSVQLESVSQEYWPIGDEIVIRYSVQGEFTEEMVGKLYVAPKEQPTETYPLKFEGYATDPKTDERCAIFSAKVQPSTVNIVYWARLGDGRTKSPSEMNLVPRPVIIDNQAWLRLPAYCGLRPAQRGMSTDERRYEQLQIRGDIVGIPDSGVRVQLTTQKPIKDAWIEFERSKPSKKPQPEKEKGTEPKKAEAKPGEIERVKQKMTFKVGGETAAFSFDLDKDLLGYRLIVADKHGFENIPPPYRSLQIVDEKKPEVFLLRDTFSDSASVLGNFDVEGMPIKLGEKIRIPYVCFGTYGLSKVQVLYRVLKKHESGDDPVDDEPWIRLSLPEVGPSETAGAFDIETGVFKRTGFDQQVPFHAVPSPEPDKLLGRTSGGGRYFLETDGLINSKGERRKLKSGDQIEYCVEVFAAHRLPEASIPFARSETRVSTVLEQKEILAWLRRLSQEHEKQIRDVEAREKAVLGGK